jgi:hypothetical protein
MFRYQERFEVYTAVTMKNAVFWDVAAATCSRWFLARGFFLFSSTLKMEAIRSSEPSVYTISTLRHIPEHGILLSLSTLT